MTVSALLLFPTELLSDSEEDQMSSNTNSYDYGEADRALDPWAEGHQGPAFPGLSWGLAQGPSAGLAGHGKQGEYTFLGEPGVRGHTCPAWPTQEMSTGLCCWVRRPLPRS